MKNHAMALLVVAACGPAGVHPATTGPAPTIALSAAPPASDCAPPPYVPQAAWSGRSASLPTPPVLPNLPQKVGDSYTVFGAVHLLNVGASLGNRDLDGEISVVGYIVDTNLARAPRCALHKTGVRDPDGCVTEIPTFTLGDVKGSTAAPTIRAMGWASNFANVFDADAQYKKLAQRPAKLYEDELWAVDIPFPLPSIGAKVKVVGRYGPSFTKSSSGISSDPQYGILTVREVVYLEAAPEPARFPQLAK
jgi:hypothetical protein